MNILILRIWDYEMTIAPPNEHVPGLERKGRSEAFRLWLVVALICMALALVFAKYSRQQPLVEFHSSVLNSVDPS
jgi:hypothetical protein